MFGHETKFRRKFESLTLSVLCKIIVNWKCFRVHQLGMSECFG